MTCRICGSENLSVFVDLGAQPLANALLESDQHAEARYPLRPMLCADCQLVQLPELVTREELFATDYPYFSSQSRAFVAHAERFVEDMVERFFPLVTPWPGPLVVEIASNDGYLLQHFSGRGIRCYGVEPARAQAEMAIRNGVPTLIEFFDANLVCERLVDVENGVIAGGKADLIIANNVLAHVPDLHAFLHGIRLLLAPEGVVSIEVPWLHDLVEQTELGTIYHEHFSYFLLATIERALTATAAPMRVFDVQPLPEIHGGSLRILACHQAARHPQSMNAKEFRRLEERWLTSDPLADFAPRAGNLKRAVWSFLLQQRASGRKVAGYCAAAKASTLLSWCGVGPELVPYIADTTPAKQGRYLPGARIPVVAPECLFEECPDTIWILAPNWASDIVPRLRAECTWAPIICWQEGERIVSDVPSQWDVTAGRLLEHLERQPGRDAA